MAGVLAAAGLYFASALSFWAVKETVADRWIWLQSWYDRWQNWRMDRADRLAEEEEFEDEQKNPGPAQRLFAGAIGAEEALEPAGQKPPTGALAREGPAGAVMGYSKSNSPWRVSSCSCSRMYCRTRASSRPTVLTQ